MLFIRVKLLTHVDFIKTSKNLFELYFFSTFFSYQNNNNNNNRYMQSKQ